MRQRSSQVNLKFMVVCDFSSFIQIFLFCFSFFLLASLKTPSFSPFEIRSHITQVGLELCLVKDDLKHLHLLHPPCCWNSPAFRTMSQISLSFTYYSVSGTILEKHRIKCTMLTKGPGCPWFSDLSAFTSWVLGLQTCTSTSGLWGTRN